MKKNKRYFLFILILFLIFYFGYKKLEENRILNNDQKIVQTVLNDAFLKDSIIHRIPSINITWKDNISFLKTESHDIISSSNSVDQPLIYLYNSHPTEEYASSNILEYMVQPTVIMNNYLLQDLFNRSGVSSIVEEKSVKDILNVNNWNYASSYRASRILMEERKTEYPSLQYFVDIHRDSLEKNRTTVQIGDKNYAQILFIVGLENENYQDNLLFTEKIVKKMDEYYPSLCKGIYKKSGEGVNGVYNQDFSPHTILIEIGGYENTTIEVMNSSMAFSHCFLEVFDEESN